MLSLSTLVVAIFLVIIVILFYNVFIEKDFNQSAFNAKVNALTEFLKNNHEPLPRKLMFISHVFSPYYYITEFDVESFKTLSVKAHDERVEHFSFLDQIFREPNNDDSDSLSERGGAPIYTKFQNRIKESSISFHPESVTKFIAHADDGDSIVECHNGEFNGAECIPYPICKQSNVDIPLTEDTLNRLVFNKLLARQRNITNVMKTHPSLYVRCDANLTPHMQECDIGETFLDNRCVTEPFLFTDEGVVLNAKLNKFKVPNIKIVSAKLHKRYHNDIQEERKESAVRIVELDADDPPKNFVKTSFESPVGITSKNTNNYSLRVNLGFQKTVGFNKDSLDRSIIEGLKNKNSNLVFPINDNSLHDNTPCTEYGTGHTYIDLTIGTDQFIECLDNHNIFIHSCLTRGFMDGKYFCDKEEICTDFEFGAGEIINSLSNDHISFDTGKTVCSNYQITQIVECDTENVVPSKQFDHPFNVSLELNLPKEVYNGELCVPFDVDLVHIKNDNFKVNVENKLNINFSKSMIGRVSKITTLEMLSAAKLSALVTYSRNLGEICLDPYTCAGLECDGEGAVVVDIFDNTQYNVCDENGEAVQHKVQMKENEYMDFVKGKIVENSNYHGECRLQEGDDYFEKMFREVQDVSCFYTMPMFELNKEDIIN
ncbi:ORF91 [Agrotis segetum granulovirus]|uniref:ORF91 n=1 Tax=Agrotis segetum granulosis virus TaxID=10464 RepID=Q6QXL2_GVAS|nr:ORF91 [Agrotis segetum granulovirus]